MKLIPYDKKDLCIGYRFTSNLKILEDFANSGLECAKVEGFPQKNAGQSAASLNQSIKRYKMFTIRAISRKGEVFLIKQSI